MKTRIYAAPAVKGFKLIYYNVILLSTPIDNTVY